MLGHSHPHFVQLGRMVGEADVRLLPASWSRSPTEDNVLRVAFVLPVSRLHRPIHAPKGSPSRAPEGTPSGAATETHGGRMSGDHAASGITDTLSDTIRCPGEGNDPGSNPRVFFPPFIR